MTCPLVIMGTGGSAYDVLDIVMASNAISPAWEPLGFLDDAREKGSCYLNLPILGGLREAAALPGCKFVNVIGSDASYRRRAEIIASANVPRDRFATLVHPGACVSPWVRLGCDVYVAFGASLGGGVKTGDHVSFSPACVVGHDSEIGDFSMIAPRALVSGFVRIGRGCYVGAGAMIRQRIEVGDGALVGLGAVVVRNVAPGATVVGNPARELKKE
jgi:sugar O-acyltransferase (sialic acid O-acetyltransferase NeuD family)